MEVTIHDNGQMVSVEVTEEVYAFLNYADHKEETPPDVSGNNGLSVTL